MLGWSSAAPLGQLCRCPTYILPGRGRSSADSGRGMCSLPQLQPLQEPTCAPSYLFQLMEDCPIGCAKIQPEVCLHQVLWDPSSWSLGNKSNQCQASIPGGLMPGSGFIKKPSEPG